MIKSGQYHKGYRHFNILEMAVGRRVNLAIFAATDLITPALRSSSLRK